MNCNMKWKYIIVTSEYYDKFDSKNYSSGRPIVVGDLMYYAMLHLIDTTIPEDINYTEEIHLTFILFHKDEYGVLYELDKKYPRSDVLIFPVFKLKKY